MSCRVFCCVLQGPAERRRDEQPGENGRSDDQGHEFVEVVQLFHVTFLPPPRLNQASDMDAQMQEETVLSLLVIERWMADFARIHAMHNLCRAVLRARLRRS